MRATRKHRGIPVCDQHSRGMSTLCIKEHMLLSLDWIMMMNIVIIIVTTKLNKTMLIIITITNIMIECDE